MNFYPNIPHFLHDLGQFQMKDLNVADNQVWISWKSVHCLP
jgi:hypothetical protein